MLFMAVVKFVLIKFDPSKEHISHNVRTMDGNKSVDEGVKANPE